MNSMTNAIRCFVFGSKRGRNYSEFKSINILYSLSTRNNKNFFAKDFIYSLTRPNLYYKQHSSFHTLTNLKQKPKLSSETVPNETSSELSTKYRSVPYNQIELPPCENSFKSSDLYVETLDPSRKQKKPAWNELVFGSHCSDHMIEIHWTASDGWQRPQIVPVHNIILHPFAKVLHYAAEVFEGLKAYRGTDGRIRLFRPELNMKRMRLSASRLCLPDFNGQDLIDMIKTLLKIDNEWIPPYESNASLYIRPTLIATDETLGVSPSTKAILYVVTGPVGPYFKTGFKPVSLLADPKYVRAWPGGSGDRKIGANYAPTLLVQKEAAKLGYQQVLWLYGPEHQLTEVGTMNIFILIKNDQGQNVLITPPLGDGLILPGVTRQSLIELLRSWNEMEVIERHVTMKEVEQWLQNGQLLEMFGAGTACIVCPIGKICFQDRVLNIPGHSFTQRMFDELLAIQYGNKQHSNWVHVI